MRVMGRVVKRRIPFQLRLRDILRLCYIRFVPLDKFTPHIRVCITQAHSVLTAQRHHMGPDVAGVICHLVSYSIQVNWLIAVIEKTVCATLLSTGAHRHISHKVAAIAEDICIAFYDCAY